MGTEEMNNEKQTISKEEAAATLKSVDATKRDAIQSFRIPLLLITLISLSYSLVVFSWGMTEHENMWALGMYIGAASFGIFVAFYLYTFRLLGIKVSVLARTKERIKSELLLLVIFGIILIAGRQVRLLGFEYAPHIAALISGGYMAYLLYKYPTGEYLVGNQK
jgi:hypothetical protein|tara:strand:+ start:129 stop:620 length:492 start_codon:yes stop_codon:yes gene_type:complete